ncbi:MAG: glycoside hydrolase family 5 protein [Anaerolinea sp.]
MKPLLANRLLIALWVWSIVGGQLMAQGSTSEPPIMKRCINFGNMLEAPNEGAWGPVLEERFVKLVAASGFDTVRVPIRWSAHAEEAPPYTIDPAFFARVDEVIDWTLEAGLTTIINVHHYEEIMQDPQAHAPRLLALWDQIATRYADYPPALVFEALNEPTNALTPRLWDEVQAEVVRTIRRTNPDRRIVVGGGSWNSLDGMLQMQVPDDPNLIATFHYYEPFRFTHQGAEWVEGTNAYLGTTWGTPFQRAELHAALMRAARWQAERGLPVLLGEFGAYSKADMASRVAWTSAVRESAEQLGFAWCYWEFAAGFGIFDPSADTFNDLFGALLPDREPPSVEALGLRRAE